MRESSMRSTLKPRDFSGFGNAPGGADVRPPAQSAGDYVRLPLDQIVPDLNQPRQLSEPQFQPSSVNQIDLDSAEGDELAELARSIVASGVLIPLIVERTGQDSYQIVAGHRRWLAAQAARDWVARNPRGKDDLKPAEGWDFNTVPAIIRDFGDADRRLAAQLIENLARQGMSKQDVGRALTHLQERSKFSYRGLAALIGRSVGYVQDCLASVNSETVEVSRMFGNTEDWRAVQRANTLRKRNAESFERLRKRFDEGEGSLRQLIDAFEREQSARKSAPPAPQEAKEDPAESGSVVPTSEREPDDAAGGELEVETRFAGDEERAFTGAAADIDEEEDSPEATEKSPAGGASTGSASTRISGLPGADKSEIPDRPVENPNYADEDQYGSLYAEQDAQPSAGAVDPNVVGDVTVQISLKHADALRLMRALRAASNLRDFPRIDFFEKPSDEAVLRDLRNAIKAVPSQ